jgi:hypothetical protein
MLRPKLLLPLAALAIAVGVVSDASPWAVLVAVAAMYVAMRAGLVIIGSFARPVPEPPPPGELRKVRIQFRCSICGTEVRMTVANDEMPDPPRHCQEDMELVTPVLE